MTKDSEGGNTSLAISVGTINGRIAITFGEDYIELSILQAVEMATSLMKAVHMVSEPKQRIIQ